MTTKTSFTETANTFNENVAKGMKLMKETNAKLVDTQQQQMEKQLESFSEQVADLTLVNQTNFDAVVKQLETAKKSFAPLTEQLKKEMEKAAVSSKETMQTIFESYAPAKDSFMELNEKTIEQLNDRMTTGMNFYTKFWSDLMDSFSPLNEKALKTTIIQEPLKTPAITNNKKHANSNSVGV